ncbi:MoxR family ATPase [Persicimonas caeni]|uniref:MoxR family ATPase n=1 Tax=Persicimonas caeni TaxID=2292766 RepID=A0A4Y6Q0K4_PERCE|nr:MoxR family ATPase [Persicimonas caeni]QDG54111.1 MoxR family ATPase [Persicimonas caeni]QED35332.1 MoxR family ATPase [Persicimonas caeni]
MTTEVGHLNEMIRERSAFVDDMRHELERVVVGQKYMVERLLIGLLTGGHVLLEGVPGLAKTLTVKSLSQCVDLDFQRIQFTPDLLPADLIGTMIYDQQTREFVPRKGPVFTNVLLADEINRAPAKVQSALLEAMQEHQVTIGETSYKMPPPFLVLATQNPIEQEGTYPLPEAQVDRFMLMIRVGYPTREEERLIMDRVTERTMPEALEAVATPEQILASQKAVREIYIDDKLKDYIVDIIFATRNPEEHGLGELKDFIEFGASPRATIYLNLAAKAHAFIRRRGYVTPEDIKAIAYDVLRHRVILTFAAEAEEYTSERVIEQILETIEVP